MHPFRFVKEHPVGVIVSAAAGMMVGPWVLSLANRYTGVNINLPSY